MNVRPSFSLPISRFEILNVLMHDAEKITIIRDVARGVKYYAADSQ